MDVTWISLQLKDVESDSQSAHNRIYSVGCLSEDLVNI